MRVVRLVSDDAVLAAAGDGARVYRMPLVTYVLGSEVLAVVFEPGDRPEGTGVQDARHAVATAPFPDDVERLLYEDLVDRRPGAPRLEGYVRLASGCLPLGSMQIVGGLFDLHEVGVAGVTFEFADVLPFEDLDRVRPAEVSPDVTMPGVEWLRLLPHDPVGALSEFVRGWYADVSPVIGPQPAVTTPMPRALVALHEAVAGRREILGRQDQLFAPHEMRLDDKGRLEFGVENQGCFLMATQLEGDPPVWFLRDDEEPERHPLPLSRFLLAMMLCEATLIGHYTVWTDVRRQDKDRVVAGMQLVLPLDGREWLDWAAQTYVGHGLVVEISRRDDKGEVYCLRAGARRREDLRRAERYRTR